MSAAGYITGVILLVLCSQPAKQEPYTQITNFQSSPGLYYDNMGKVKVYSITWRIVSYFNLMELKEKFESTKVVARRANSYCTDRLALINMSTTECKSAGLALQWHIGKIERAQSLIGQLVRHESHIKKRGIMNFVGEVSKILFGTLDEDDATYFKARIDVLEAEQQQLLRLSKEQVTIVKATLTSFNRTVSSIAKNEEIITQGMKQLSKHIVEYENSTDRRLQKAVILITLNEQLIQLTGIFNELEREYDMLIVAIVNAQKGILEPHLINPVQIVKYLELIKDDIKDKRFPVDLTADNGYRLIRIIDLDVFIDDNILGYVLNIPLVEDDVYNLYRLIPLPSEVDGTKHLFMYIAPEKELLLIDNAKRQYAKLSSEQLKCKIVDQSLRICKQVFILLFTYDHEQCEAKMLQPIREIPKDCVQKLIVLNESLWTPLSNNEWLFVAPVDEGITVICHDGKPMDFMLKGTGKFKFLGKCRGYTAKMVIQSDHIIRTAVQSSDIIPNMTMELDCCIVNNEKRNISQLKLDLPIYSVGRQLDDLTAAGHKLDELKNEIEYQQRTVFSNLPFYHFSLLSYIGSSVVIIIIICCICRY